MDKGKYWILTYWSREGGRRIQEYIGLDEGRAYGRLIEVLLDKVAYYQERLDEARRMSSKEVLRVKIAVDQTRVEEAEKHLNKMEVKA